MNQSSLPDRQWESTAYARIRDSAVCSLLENHPVTADMLVRLGWFPNKNSALARLRRLAARRRVTRLGTVWRKMGAPEIVYCRWRPKADHLLHEVELTDVCLQLSAGRILRGPAIADRELRPDAEVWINGSLYYLELDRGTMRVEQVARRFHAYRQCPHLSLWVCADAKRAEELRLRAEALRSTALFTTLAEALAGPHAAIWRDFAGGAAALPRERGAAEPHYRFSRTTEPRCSEGRRGRWSAASNADGGEC